MRLVSILMSVLIVILTLVELRGQSIYQNDYLKGKSYFSEGKYQEAMEPFKKATFRDPENPFQAYASFYYALSAFNSGDVITARNMFLQIQDRFPDWANRAEVELWLAYFDLLGKDYDSAYKKLSSLANTRPSMRSDIERIEEAVYSQFQDPDTLRMLLEKFPDNAIIARRLAKSIKAQPLIMQDQALLENLVEVYELDKASFDIIEADQSKKKDQYRVAVVLPFMYNAKDSLSNIKRNRFVYDVYEGILLAQKRLKEQGVSLEVRAFDTRKSAESTEEILSLSYLKACDLIIGPLFPEPVLLVSAFSAKYKINMINPMSTNSQVVGNNPYSFLFKPSLETQARVAARFASQHFKNKTGIIFYEDNPRDSLVAAIYHDLMVKEGFHFIHNRAYRRQSAYNITSYLTKAEERVDKESIREGQIQERVKKNKFYSIEEDSVGHIFVASKDELIAANVISGIETRPDKIPVIGMEEWLDNSIISIEQLERLPIYLISPNYLNPSRPQLVAFKESYIKENKSLPSKNLLDAYEMTMLVGKLMGDYGNYFQNGFKNEIIPGEFFEGFYYFKSNDNQFVPIVRFENSELYSIPEEEWVIKKDEYDFEQKQE